MPRRLVHPDNPRVGICRRHTPCYPVFEDGPNWGRDVFLPPDAIIGGPARIGQGWKMLMSALAAGRGISLPSLSAAGTAFAARTTGAYARVRQQFNTRSTGSKASKKRSAVSLQQPTCSMRRAALPAPPSIRVIIRRSFRRS